MITCRSAEELVKLRAANQLVARILEDLRRLVVPGATTAGLDAEAERLVRDAGAQPAFKGYRGFPATICASRNHEVVHGIPSGQALVEGDILSIDMGVKLDGYYGDSAVTVGVGAISAEAQRLLDVTDASLYRGIDAVRPGARVSDIGHAVQAYVEAQGFTVVREFVGHGIGTKLHEEPQIPNYGPAGTRAAVVRGHGARDRAHGERGTRGGAGVVGRLDGGDGGRPAVGALRAHGGGHGRGRGDPDAQDGAGGGRREREIVNSNLNFRIAEFHEFGRHGVKDCAARSSSSCRRRSIASASIRGT